MERNAKDRVSFEVIISRCPVQPLLERIVHPHLLHLGV